MQLVSSWYRYQNGSSKLVMLHNPGSNRVESFYGRKAKENIFKLQ